ncbi:MAG: hypothetical protein KF744_08505 [Taibaiella sp.]|nr:hypothetical protein [Taibaiella sp.]
MESTLLSGQYSVTEAEQLLSRLFDVPTEFQIGKIDKASDSEEDIEQSERTLSDISGQLRGMSQLLRRGGNGRVKLVASLSLEYCEPQDHN